MFQQNSVRNSYLYLASLRLLGSDYSFLYDYRIIVRKKLSILSDILYIPVFVEWKMKFDKHLFFDMYFKKMHQDDDLFCQQSNNHLDVVKANRDKGTLLKPSFNLNRMNVDRRQYEFIYDRRKMLHYVLFCEKLKVIFLDNQGNFKLFEKILRKFLQRTFHIRLMARKIQHFRMNKNSSYRKYSKFHLF